MKNSHVLALALASFAILCLSTPHLAQAAASKADATYIQKVADGEMAAAGLAEKTGKTGWWARSWSKGDGNGFFGKPELATKTENTDTNIVIRYTRYSTEYDVEFHSPVWGAYTLDKTAVKNDVDGERPASNPDFARPGQFFQEPLVVARSKTLDVVAASHGTFTSTFDPRFPFLKEGAGVSADDAKKSKADRSIQRGHMVPNNAMKCQGVKEQGQTAQIESFSVANIVPQMAKSNAPSWSGLESACFDWANELGQVWLIVGPVYHDRENPIYIKKVKDGSEQILPSPDELFYVVIGKRNGKTAAIGFLMPHDPTIIDYKSKAVSVDEIEKKTGLNFMPELAEPNAIEATVDPVWLQTQPRKETKDEDN